MSWRKSGILRRVTAKERATRPARIAAALALLMLVLLAGAGCSAVELYRGNASATAAAAESEAAATENPTISALAGALLSAEATRQALSNRATDAALPELTPTPAPTIEEALLFPASAESRLYGKVPIDSDRLNIIAALAIDADGQLLAATRAGEIYALPDSDGDGAADETRQIFADEAQDLGQVAGMIVRGEGLILLNGQRLSLLRDADGDGIVDSVTHLSEGLPADQSPLQSSNGILQAPDGRLFSVDISAGEIFQIVLRE